MLGCMVGGQRNHVRQVRPGEEPEQQAQVREEAERVEAGAAEADEAEREQAARGASE